LLIKSLHLATGLGVTYLFATREFGCTWLCHLSLTELFNKPASEDGWFNKSLHLTTAASVTKLVTMHTANFIALCCTAKVPLRSFLVVQQRRLRPSVIEKTSYPHNKKKQFYYLIFSAKINITIIYSLPKINIIRIF
jgi:hypothetical protein